MSVCTALKEQERNDYFTKIILNMRVKLFVVDSTPRRVFKCM